MVHQAERDALGAVREHVQLHVVVRRGGAVQHRPDQPRLELAQPAHRLDRGQPLREQRLDVIVAAEQPLVLGQRLLDLGIARQHRAVDDAEALGGLALGEQEVAHAVLGHHPRRLLRQRASQVLLLARGQLAAHQNSGSEPEEAPGSAGLVPSSAGDASMPPS